jgi:hypothetical protein
VAGLLDCAAELVLAGWEEQNARRDAFLRQALSCLGG